MLDYRYTEEWFKERSIDELRKYRKFLYFMLIDATGYKRERLDLLLNRCRYELNYRTGETKY